MQTLTFQNITLTPVKTDNQIWLSSADLAKALGYSQDNAVAKIYNRNADEFTQNMTQIIEITEKVKLTTPKNTQNLVKKVRIFSLRGCHLIAMFARTAVAKEFRKWVLDILEMVTRTDSHQRATLVTACDKLAVGNALRSDIYKMVGNHFGYDDVASIPAPLLPEAVAYVYELLLSKKAPAIDDGILQSAQHLAWHTQFIYSWYKAIEQPFRMLSPQLSGQIHDHIIHAKLEATHIGKQIGYDGMNPAVVEKKVWAVGFN